jgi:hypothetical protein
VGYGLRDTGYELRYRRYGLRDTGYGFRGMGYGLRDNGYALRYRLFIEICGI